MSRFFCDCDCDCLAQVKTSQQCFWAPKSAFSHQIALRFSLAPQAIAILLVTFRGRKHPHCGLAGDRDVCDRDSPRLRLQRQIAVRFSLPQKVASNCDSLCDFSKEKKSPHCGLAGDMDDCDRKSRGFCDCDCPTAVLSAELVAVRVSGTLSHFIWLCP